MEQQEPPPGTCVPTPPHYSPSLGSSDSDADLPDINIP